MPDGTSGTSSHLHHGRPKVVRIPTRRLMYPPMLHPETPVRSLLLEDMSDQEGVGSASNPEATLTHPSARDPSATRGNLPPSLCSGYDSNPLSALFA